MQTSQIRKNTPSMMGPAGGATKKRPRRTLVLCFDGTGNQFHGDSSDSNILKIFRMLDRSSGKGFHYYQPGIGTYVHTSSLSSTGSLQRLMHWYVKAKDSAVGTSFDQHVVGGYKFLMQFYSPGDNIYMFGFSRGSYTARFLAEMVDWVGLITHGNEEMIRFAWKTFSKWKAINVTKTGAQEEERKAYHFMVSFRETFSRPVRRIRFLGLFDTVNSVPRFESAVLSRHRIPFSAVSSAKIIRYDLTSDPTHAKRLPECHFTQHDFVDQLKFRHAVSIDERRAKFRADLVSHGAAAKKKAKMEAEKAAANGESHHHDWMLQSSRYSHKKPPSRPVNNNNDKTNSNNKERLLSVADIGDSRGRRSGHDRASERERETSRYRSHSRSRSHVDRPSAELGDGVSVGDNGSIIPSGGYWEDDDSSDGDEDVQDIEEVWFPGCHADIGGGWEVGEGETPLSHIPLVWIVKEAQKAGLEMDEEKMANLNCLDEYIEEPAQNLPKFELSTTSGEEIDLSNKEDRVTDSKVDKILLGAATDGKIHDCLRFKQGLPSTSVMRWRMMEWIPFRRLDLTNDGLWKAIRWPLPRGEVRDMPADAKVHHSAIRRLKTVSNYRPGNLILGGGGRGVIVAPKNAGIGDWDAGAYQGDIVREYVVRKAKAVQEEHRNGEKH